MARTVLIAWLVAGTLDILSAFLFAGMAGMTPGQVLQFVASGPFGDAMKGNPAGVPLGLFTHYSIMLMMVWAYVIVAPRYSAPMRHPVIAGALYGLVLWLLMYWIVRPMRFPAMALPGAWAGMPPGKVAWSIGNALFSHCVLVGIPIAWLTARARRA